MARQRVFEVPDTAWNPAGRTFVNVNTVFAVIIGAPDFTVYLYTNGIGLSVGTFTSEADAMDELAIWTERIDDAP